MLQPDEGQEMGTLLGPVIAITAVRLTWHICGLPGFHCCWHMCVAFLSSTVGRLGPLLLGRYGPWGGLTLPSSVIATTIWVGVGSAAVPKYESSQQVSVGFPLPSLLAKEQALFIH